jgi:hypothetical protein
VRLTRPELETMIRPALTETIGSLERAMQSAGVTPEQVSRVLLVGGSSRIPLVAEMVSGAFGRPVAIDAHPKHAVALGAAVAASSFGPAETAVAVADEVRETEAVEVPSPPPEPTTPLAPSMARSTPTPTSKPRRRIVKVGALVVLVLAVAAVVFVVRGGDDAAAVCPELSPAELSQATGAEARPIRLANGARCTYDAAAVPGALPDNVVIDAAAPAGCSDGSEVAIDGRKASTCRRPGPSDPFYNLTLYFTRDGKAMQATVDTLIVDAQRWVTAFEKVGQAIADPA